ncbi:MAG: DUF47 family protein [Candidatus Micrarchaeia archaeon]
MARIRLFKKLLSGGEERIIGESTRILRIGIEATDILKSGASMGTKLEKVRNLEKLSDNVVFGLSKEITSGGVAPNLIDNLLELINTEDNIIDSLYNLTRELSRYEIREKGINAQIQAELGSFIDLAGQALQILIKMETSDDLYRMGRYRAEIEKVEESGDEIKDSMFDFAYHKPNINFKTFYHIFQIAHMSDDVLDNCEDASDSFLTIMSSIIS